MFLGIRRTVAYNRCRRPVPGPDPSLDDPRSSPSDPSRILGITVHQIIIYYIIATV